jgi:uncharacterized protein (DUF305 family)
LHTTLASHPEGFCETFALPLPALAQTDHSGHQMAGDQSPASIAFAEANAKMHADINVPLTGNADVDMARIVLEHGTDPEVRKLAEMVIAAQEAEIAWMTQWLAKQPK